MSTSQLMSHAPEKSVCYRTKRRTEREIAKEYRPLLFAVLHYNGFSVQYCPNSNDRRLQRN